MYVCIFETDCSVRVCVIIRLRVRVSEADSRVCVYICICVCVSLCVCVRAIACVYASVRVLYEIDRCIAEDSRHSLRTPGIP